MKFSAEHECKNYSYNNKAIVNVAEKLICKYWCDTTHISEKSCKIKLEP